MALWGRNDQAVTANSTTTKETTTGAPMGVHSSVAGGLVSASANAKFGNTSPGSMAAIDANLFNNTTPGAFVAKLAVGVFGVSATEMANNNTNSSKEHGAHAGWNLRKAGTGSITNIAYTGTATGYNNTDVITVSSPAAGGNATATVSTNSTGGALILTTTNVGSGFMVVNATPNTTIANSTGGASAGSGATFSAVAGGRAGRIFYETLVAMGSLGAQTSPYGTPATVSDAATDNTLLPGT